MPCVDTLAILTLKDGPEPVYPLPSHALSSSLSTSSLRVDTLIFALNHSPVQPGVQVLL